MEQHEPGWFSWSYRSYEACSGESTGTTREVLLELQELVGNETAHTRGCTTTTKIISVLETGVFAASTCHPDASTPDWLNVPPILLYLLLSKHCPFPYATRTSPRLLSPSCFVGDLVKAKILSVAVQNKKNACIFLLMDHFSRQ